MRIIFLDIDGVLNSANWWQEEKLEKFDAHHAECPPRRKGAGYELLNTLERQDVQQIDPDAVARLNQIIYFSTSHRLGDPPIGLPVVVITSSWRLTTPLSRIDHVLRFRGFAHRIIGATPDIAAIPDFYKGNGENMEGHDAGSRGLEIAYFLEGLLDVEQFVILDDCNDMGPLEDHLVLTSPLVGLSNDDVVRAIEILKGN